MLHIESGSLADWIGNIIAFLGILVALYVIIVKIIEKYGSSI